MATKINVYGTLTSGATDAPLANASEIYDESLSHFQDEVNAYVKHVYVTDETLCFDSLTNT